MKYETNIIGQLKKVIRPHDERFRYKFYVFLVCLAISIFLWFLIALSSESTSTLVYPIVYKNMPEKLLLANKPDSVLTVRVASGGFEMITLKYLTRRNPVEIDLSDLDLESRGNQLIGDYSTSGITQRLIDRYNFTEELVSVSPNQILFKFENLAGKTVPVVPDLSLSFQGLYRLRDSIVVVPDSVLVTGAKELLDQIDFVKTAKKELKNINGPVKVMADIQIPKNIDRIDVRPSQVELTLNAEKFTEAKIEIEVSAQYGEYRVKTFPKQVVITYLVPLKDYNRIKPDMFIAGVSIPDDQTVSRVPVEIIKQPSFTEIIKIEPAQVEYFVISND